MCIAVPLGYLYCTKARTIPALRLSKFNSTGGITSQQYSTPSSRRSHLLRMVKHWASCSSSRYRKRLQHALASRTVKEAECIADQVEIPVDLSGLSSIKNGLYV